MRKPKISTGIVVLIVFAVCMIGTQATCAQASTPLANYNNIYVKAANDEGIAFDINNDGTYYIQATQSPGMGLNAVHITTDPTVSYGQVTVSSNQSGVFYITDTGGRGYEDDIVLMLAVNGTIPDDFMVRIKTSGYSWTPSYLKNAAPVPGAIKYRTNAIDEMFTKNDLIYGPQNWKPTGGDANYPIFYGESMSDPDNMFYIMFIDTHVGTLGTNYPWGSSSLVNKGAAEVEYTFMNLSSYAVFNLYAWNYNTNQGQGMLWTNRVLPPTGTGGPNGGINSNAASGYSVTGVTASKSTPTPVPKGTATPTSTTNTTPSTTAKPNAALKVTPTVTLTTQADGATVTPAAGLEYMLTPVPSSSTTDTRVKGESASEIPSLSYPVSILLFTGTAMIVGLSRRKRK